MSGNLSSAQPVNRRVGVRVRQTSAVSFEYADGFNEAGALAASFLLGSQRVGGGSCDDSTVTETDAKKSVLRGGCGDGLLFQ
jgi:hypothetical protein